MTMLDGLIDDMAAPGCIAADGLARSGALITEMVYLDAVTALHKTVSTSAKSRGASDPVTLQFLMLGATVHFGVRLADLTERTAL